MLAHAGPDRRSTGVHATVRPRPLGRPRPRRRGGGADHLPFSVRPRARGAGLRGPRALLPARLPSGHRRRAGGACCAQWSTSRTCAATGGWPSRPTSSTTSGCRSPPSTAACFAPKRPRVYTMHWRLPEAGSPDRPHAHPAARRDGRGRGPLRARGAAPRADFGVPAERLRVIPHGAFDYLTRQDDEIAAARRSSGGRGAGDPRLRPDPPLQGDRRPARGLLAKSREPSSGSSACRGCRWRSFGSSRDRAPGTVRFVDRFIPDDEIPAFMRRADLVVLPYRNIEQSGVLYTALAFGRPLVLSSVGGFPEIAERGAARLVPPEDPEALAEALTELLADRDTAAGARRPPPPGRLRPRTPGIGSPSRPWPSTGTCSTIRNPIIPAHGARDRLLGRGRPDRLRPPGLSAAALGAGRDLRRGRREGARAEDRRRAPPRHPDHPGLRRGGGDRAEDRQREGARLSRPIGSRSWWPRTARATGRRSWPARRGPTRSWSCPAAARSRRSTRPPPRRAGAILAFSDANSYWRPDALRRLVARFADERVGYACGQVRFEGGEGGNQEGLYWRYEMAVRSMETRLAGSPPGTARSTRSVARPTSSSTRAAARTSASRSSSPSVAGAPSTSRGRSPRRRWRRRSRASSAASAG